MEKINGTKVISGAFGKLYMDNIELAELQEVNATITANRSDVQMGLSVDSKITGLAGSGSFTVNKVYSRSREIFENWRKGHDKRVSIVIDIIDPDALDGQNERVSLDNVWFNEISIGKFSRGEIVTEEFPFGFTPTDASFDDFIK